MQNAKDSFYEVLRGRLAALNPERTVVVRGSTRPGLVVDENETESVGALPDCFHISWTGATVTTDGSLPLVSLVCKIGYCTVGNSLNGGLDRGRALSSMDAELLVAVQQLPQNTVKTDFSALAHGGATQTMSTRLWWSDVVFGAVETKAGNIGRTASIQVMSFQEAGEL